MSKLRLVFIISLIILGVLLVVTVFRPMAIGGEFSTVARESVIRDSERWTIELNIINKEGKDVTYTIIWSSGEESKTQQMRVGDGRVYNHIHFVYPEAVKDGKVDLIIYKGDEATPFEQTTYYIDFD